MPPTASNKQITDKQGSKQKLPALMSVVKVVAGNGSYVILGFLANIISANGLTPAEFGQVSICLAILNVLQEVCGSGVDLTMVRLAAPHIHSSPQKAHSYYKVALHFKLLINIIVAYILWVSSPFLVSFTDNRESMVTLLRWISVGLIGASLYNYSLARLQAEERFTLYALLKASNNIAKLLILVAIWALNYFNPSTVLAAWMSSFFVGYILSLLIQNKSKDTNSDKQDISKYYQRYWSEVIHYSKWVIGSSFLFTLYSRVDMLILARHTSAAEIGHYAAAWNITFIIDLVTNSVIVALLPKATNLTTRTEFANYMKHTFFICLAIAILLTPMFFLSEMFFNIFFPSYLLSSEIFRVLFIGAIITLLFHPLYLILFIRNKVHRLTLVNFLLVVFALIFGIIFIPEYGTIGAAWVTVSGRIFASILIVFFVVHELKVTLADAPK